MCTALLPPCDNPIAVNKYVISYHISYHIITYHINSFERTILSLGCRHYVELLRGKFLRKCDLVDPRLIFQHTGLRKYRTEIALQEITS